MNNKVYKIITDTRISKDDEQIRIAFYANIGFFIQLSQMLEYNLRKLLCYMKALKEIEQNEMNVEQILEVHKKYNKYYQETYENKYSLGKLCNELSKEKVFDTQIIGHIKEINDYRINIVHLIFQNNVITNNLENSKNVLDYIENILVPRINKTDEYNKFIVKCIKDYKNDFDYYVNK